VRLAEKSSAQSKMVNGLLLTKKWQIKVGEVGDFAKFPDVEAQVVVKQGNDFVPVDEGTEGATAASDGVSGHSSGSASTPAQDAEEAQTTTKDESDPPVEFTNMTVEQLKNYLIAKGVAQTELRNATKPELIERAEFIWSQK
jgi:hypothetical protein